MEHKHNSHSSKHNSHSSKHVQFMMFTIVVFAILYIVLKYLGVGTDYLWWGVIFACIGMHIWMMKGHGKNKNADVEQVNNKYETK